MDILELLSLLRAHAWLPASVLVIAFLIRLVKDDTILPITIPARVRAWAALLLGVVAGVLNAVIGGTPWSAAIQQGVLAAITAIIGHNLVIESLRGGREFSPAWLLKKPTPPSNGSGTGSIDPGQTPKEGLFASPIAKFASLLTTALLLANGLLFLLALACTPSQKRDAKTVIDLATGACVTLTGRDAGGLLETICATEEELAPIVKYLIGARRFRNANPTAVSAGMALDPCALPAAGGGK